MTLTLFDTYVVVTDSSIFVFIERRYGPTDLQMDGRTYRRTDGQTLI